MGEVRIDMNDISVYFPKRLDGDFIRLRGNKVQRVIVVCDDTCELPPEIRGDLVPEHWKLPVTKQQLEEVRGIRDLARIRVYDLLKELATGASF